MLFPDYTPVCMLGSSGIMAYISIAQSFFQYLRSLCLHNCMQYTEFLKRRKLQRITQWEHFTHFVRCPVLYCPPVRQYPVLLFQSTRWGYKHGLELDTDYPAVLDWLLSTGRSEHAYSVFAKFYIDMSRFCCVEARNYTSTFNVTAHVMQCVKRADKTLCS